MKISLHPKPGILDWIDLQIENGRFYNRTHAFEFCVAQEMLRETGNGDSKANEAPRGQ